MNANKFNTRSKGGTFSAETEDAVDSAHAASATAHQKGTQDAHERAARLHRQAAKRYEADGDQECMKLHLGIATGHDAMATSATPNTVPDPDEEMFLEETDGGYVTAIPNEAAIDDQGWGLIAPFGEWPKTRIYRENGAIKEQKFVQVLDNESVDAMMKTENSFFRTLKRALVGIPVYKGHGDLNDHDPKALSNEKSKIKLGVIDKIRKTDRGVEAHYALDNDGAAAVAGGWKFPSAFWLVMPLTNDGDTIRARPFKLLSVALTQYHNISGVESLANARERQLAQTSSEQNQTPDNMKLIAGWLIAQGVALANSEAPTEMQVLEAFQKLHTTKTEAAVALGNEKQSLSGQITTLESERDAQKKLATDNATALANEQTAHKASRKAAAGLIVDAAITRGIKSVAERDATIEALANSADLEKDGKALLATRPVHKTEQSGRDMSGKQESALSNEAQQLQAEYDSAFKTELAATGQNPVAAHNNIMRLPKYTGLAAKFVPKKF